MRVYGELEFWFALLKVVTIVVLIVTGLAVICFTSAHSGRRRVSPIYGRTAASCRSGCSGVLLTLQIVMFAYQGSS